MTPPAAILDMDGTLVDNNYQQALAWHHALRRVDVLVPVWKVHRAVGIGGDKVIAELAGEEVEEQRGDEIRDHESEIFDSMVDDVAPLEGAAAFIRELTRRGNTVVVASSGSADDVDRFIDLLEVGHDIDACITADDVEASKPEPDLIEAAVGKIGGGPAVMVGDSVWDVKAAERAGLETIGVLSGGYSDEELRDAGAAAVYESVDELRRQLGDSLLA